MIQPRPLLASIPVYKPGKPIEEVTRELGLRRVFKLASNENPLGPSPKALAAARLAMQRVNLYPEGAAPLLRQALAHRFRLEPGQFILGNGSDEVLAFAATAFAGPGKTVAFSDRSFAVYKIAGRLSGARTLAVPSPDFQHDLPGLLKAARKASVVYVCNPNNPSGSWHPHRAIEGFLKKVPSRCLIVLDEAYAEFAGQTEAREAAWVRRFPNLLITRTFSKSYGLAGLRIGYGLAQLPIIQALEACRPPFNTSVPAQAAALGALKDKAFLARTLRNNRLGMQTIERDLASLGLKSLPSKANFILFQEPAMAPSTGQSWADFLLHGGLIVRQLEKGWIRVSIGLPAQNAAFIHRLALGLGMAGAR